MKRYGLAGLLVGVVALVAAGATMRAADTAPTFSKDVLPILQKNCQGCHRPGQIAPMSLLSYEDARPWARNIKTKVEARQMPPWFADPQYGHFLNDRSLKQSEIDTIVKWVDAGAPQGNPKDAPAPLVWPENGWFIKPDVIVKGPEFQVPAHPKNNVIEWTNITVPSGFTKDTWITSLEIKPSDLSVTHHICISFVPHVDTVQYYTPIWRDTPRDEEGVIDRPAGGAAAQQGRAGLPPNTNGDVAPQGGQGAQSAAGGGGVPPGTGARTVGAGGFEGCYVPGTQYADYRPFHAGKLIPANTDIVFQVHYTPTGKDSVDVPLLGFTVADTPPEKRYISYNISGAGPMFAIPPNEGELYEPTGRRDVRSRCPTRRYDAAHASAREGHDLPPDLSGWTRRDCVERAPLRLQLAGRLQPGDASADSEGRKAARRSSLQQLGVQQVQPESEPNGVSRYDDVGRDDVAVLRRDR